MNGGKETLKRGRYATQIGYISIILRISTFQHGKERGTMRGLNIYISVNFCD